MLSAGCFPYQYFQPGQILAPESDNNTSLPAPGRHLR